MTTVNYTIREYPYVQGRQLGYAEVRVYPELISSRGGVIYTINTVVNVNGERFQTQQVLTRDDIESHFDMIWRHTGEHTRKLIMEKFPASELAEPVDRQVTTDVAS